MRSLVLVAGESAQWAGEWLVAAVAPSMTVHLVGAGPGDPRLLTLAAADAAARRRGSSSTTGRRWTRSSRSRPRRRAALRRPRARPQGAAAGRGQRAADRARRATATSCGSRAATRSWPRAAARRRSRCRPRGSTCDVIPGVSAALAAPAAAGIPLMLRQLSVTATFVDGNDDDEHAEPPDWDALARLGGTLVILTGRGRIRRIAAALMAGGRAPDTPIAAISAAGRARAARPARHARRAPRAAATARHVRRRRRRRARPHGALVHIPDGFLTGEAAAIGAVTAAAGIGVCLHRASRTARERDLPMAGLAAAFFVVGEAPRRADHRRHAGAPARRGAGGRAARAVARRADDHGRLPDPGAACSATAGSRRSG